MHAFFAFSVVFVCLIFNLILTSLKRKDFIIKTTLYLVALKLSFEKICHDE